MGRNEKGVAQMKTKMTKDFSFPIDERDVITVNGEDRFVGAVSSAMPGDDHDRRILDAVEELIDEDPDADPAYLRTIAELYVGPSPAKVTS
ncbi:MAG: hypothetical protein KF819_23210 [Labilithrix sp.]|nr:hypothetical protein [Labilithrix sp.]